MENIYSWKSGSHCKGDPNKIGLEFEKIGSQITAESVIDYAEKHKRAEINKNLEWDNAAAGHQYRLIQARHLLNSITIEKECVTPKGEKQVIITKAYENVKIDNDERYYIPIDTALAVPEHREYVIGGILKAIQDLQEKALTYETYLKNPTKFKGGLDTALNSL